MTNVANTLGSLLESGLFADAEVYCQGRVWKVHRSILITQSCFFDKAFTGDFEVSQIPTAYRLYPFPC